MIVGKKLFRKIIKETHLEGVGVCSQPQTTLVFVSAQRVITHISYFPGHYQ
jgi:hypothetical protein